MPTADQLHAIALIVVAATPAISWIGYLWRPRQETPNEPAENPA